MERAIYNKVFGTKYLKKKSHKKLIFFHKLSVEDHFHDHFCTFGQFCFVSGCGGMVLIYSLFMIIEIEIAVAKQAKK